MRETRRTDQPERQMAFRALVPGAVLAVAAFGVGFAANGLRAAVSALLGVLLVSASFAAYVMVLGRVRRISPAAMQGAAIVTALVVATYEAWALLAGRIRAPLELDVAADDRVGGTG